MADKLTAEALNDARAKLDGWALVKGLDAIQKSFKFKDFNQAFGFMTQAAMMAERMDHHPEWFNVYNTVDVTLATHSADGVTELDGRVAGFRDRAGA